MMGDVDYVVGVSGLGKFDKPVWCSSSAPFDASIFGANYTAATNSLQYVVAFNFVEKRIKAIENNFNHFLCESY
jgi:hypothetical protein